MLSDPNTIPSLAGLLGELPRSVVSLYGNGFSAAPNILSSLPLLSCTMTDEMLLMELSNIFVYGLKSCRPVCKG